MAYIVNRDAPYSGLASLMAMHGQHGDTELVHMSKPEVRGLSSLGKLTINPDTGLPEAFNLGSLLPVIANVGLAFATGGMSVAGQMAVMGASNFIRGKMEGKSSGAALLQGAMAAGTSGLGRVLTGAASGAASGLGSATGAVTDSAAGFGYPDAAGNFVHTGTSEAALSGALESAGHGPSFFGADAMALDIGGSDYTGASDALSSLSTMGGDASIVTPSTGSKVLSWIKDNPLETASLGGTALAGLLGDDDSEELPPHTVKPFTDNTYSLEGGPSRDDKVLTEEEILRRALEGADEESDLYNPSQYQYVKQPDDFYTTNLNSGGLVNTPSNSSHTMFSLGQGLAGLATGGQVSLLQNLLGGMTRDQFSPAPQQQFETVGGVANFDGVTDDFLLDLALKGSGYQGRESASSRSPNSPAPKGYTFLDSPLSFIEKDVPITPNIVEPVVAIRENMDGDPDQPEPTDTNPTIEAIAEFLGYGPQDSVGSAASSGITGIDITGEGGIGGAPGADDTTDNTDEPDDEPDDEGEASRTRGGIVGLAHGGKLKHYDEAFDSLYKLGVKFPELERMLAGETEASLPLEKRLRRVNAKSNATGIFQFLPKTAKDLGTTTSKIKEMSLKEQSDLYAKYLKMYKWQPGVPLGMMQAAPSMANKPDDHIAYKKKSEAYKQNPKWVGPEGEITVESIKKYYDPNYNMESQEESEDGLGILKGLETLLMGSEDTQTTLDRGDTLIGKAKEYKISLEELLKANPNIQNPNEVLEGQEINIPDNSNILQRIQSILPFSEGGTIDQYFEGQVVGKGDGQSDEILFEVEGKNPDKALLSRDEYVLPADMVSIIGNGSSNAGAKELDRFVKNTRQQGFGTQQQQRRVNPQKGLSALV